MPHLGRRIKPQWIVSLYLSGHYHHHHHHHHHHKKHRRCHHQHYRKITLTQNVTPPVFWRKWQESCPMFFCRISVRLVVLRCEAITDFAKTRDLSILFKVASDNKSLAFSIEAERISEIFREIRAVHTSEYAAMSFLLSDWLYSDFMECENKSYNIKGLFTWRCGTPGRWGNPLRWGNPPVHIMIHYKIKTWLRLHDRWGDPPHVTSPTWGPPPPCKQAVSLLITFLFSVI